jgi:hypothetical protein
MPSSPGAFNLAVLMLLRMLLHFRRLESRRPYQRFAHSRQIKRGRDRALDGKARPALRRISSAPLSARIII